MGWLLICRVRYKPESGWRKLTRRELILFRLRDRTSYWKLSHDRIVQYIRKSTLLALLLHPPPQVYSTCARLLSHIPLFSAPTHPYHFSPIFPIPTQSALSRARLVILFLVFHCFARLLCENHWVLAVHSVLRVSQRELT
jgi:UDP:flavonoid glycosyltransferase YjiC (YdhE family)